MATLLLYGDTLRYPSLRHEVPLEIMDPFLFVERDGAKYVLTSSLEADRIGEALPSAEIVNMGELGFYDLVDGQMPRDEAEIEVVVRALRAWGVEDAVVAPDLPIAVADARPRGRHHAHGRRERRRGPPPGQDGGRAGRDPPRPGRRRGGDGGGRAADPRTPSGATAACTATASCCSPRTSAPRSARPAPTPARPRRPGSWSSRP